MATQRSLLPTGLALVAGVAVDHVIVSDKPAVRHQSFAVAGLSELGSMTGETPYFANCREARAAGAAPVRIGDPGYAAHLDRDHDGVGCE